MKVKKIKALLVVLSFLLPFALAAWVFQHANLFHFKTTNRGHLLAEPSAILGAWSAQDGRWQVLYWPDEQSSFHAEKLLYQLHQMRIAIGRNKTQLAVSVVLPQDCLAQPWCQQQSSIEKSDIVTLHANSNDFIRQLSLSDQQAIKQASGKVYLIDPEGYFFMYYAQTEDPLNILQDLQHILGVSSRG